MPSKRPRRDFDAHYLKSILRFDNERCEWIALVSRGRIEPGEVVGRVSSSGYLQLIIKGKFYQSSHLSWLYHKGKWPEMRLDHIDQNTLNDRIDNLREATNSQNAANRGLRADNTSGVRGVSHSVHRLRSKPWEAHITVDGVSKQAYFKTREEAIAQRQEWEREAWGDFNPKKGGV